MVKSSCLSMVLVILGYNNFANVKYNKVIMTALAVLDFSVVTFVCMTKPYEYWKLAFVIIGGIILALGILRSLDIFTQSILLTMKQKINSNLKFKGIFDHLEECVIIVDCSNNEIEYVNKQFYNIFNKEIMKEWYSCIEKL